MLEAREIARIRATVERLEPELVELRRDLRRHPELGWAETRTTKLVVDRLRAAGLEPTVMSRGTGVICDVGTSDGRVPRIGLRGDIDALPIQDETDGDHRSMVDGVCHACGHDVHTAIILGAGLALADLAAAGAAVVPTRLVFQPAEERTPGGALDVIEQGYLDGLERLYALHCDPKIESGRLGFLAGGITAAATRLRIDLHGPGGHTARPQLGADLVFALGSVVAQLPAVLSRRYDPRAALSLVWGQIHAGAVANAMPQGGFVEGTIRTLDVDAWRSLADDIPQIVDTLLAPYGVKVDINLDHGVPPCVNDAASIDHLRQVAIAALGADRVTATEQSMGGEDFAWMIQHLPGALVRLGVRPVGQTTAADLHQGRFDIDEDAIGLGTMFLTAAVQSHRGQQTDRDRRE
jgi:amidohydrolase